MIIQLKIIDKEFKEYKSILCEPFLLPEKVQRKQEYSLNENKSTINKQIKNLLLVNDAQFLFE